MRPCLAGFAHELVKLAKPEHDQPDEPHRSRARDYLTSMLIGAAAAPMLSIAGRAVTRHLRNRAIEHAVEDMRHSPERTRILEGAHRGPLFGHERPDLPPTQRPLITSGDVAGDVVKAALGGSIVQMLRDHLAGR